MFDERYQVFLANTAESKEIHYKLRYKIYCLEKKYEDTTKFTRQLEIDEYDSDAIHFLIRDKFTGDWMATVRLLIGPLNTLPIQKAATIGQHVVDSETELVAEISRFSILSNYRNNNSHLKPEDIEPVKEPEIMLGLFRAVVAYGEKNGISNWLFLCRRSLKRIMNQCGFIVDVVGPKTNHKGIRYPYRISLEKSFSRMQELAPKVNSMFSANCAYYKYSEIVDSMQLPCAA